MTKFTGRGGVWGELLPQYFREDREDGVGRGRAGRRARLLLTPAAGLSPSLPSASPPNPPLEGNLLVFASFFEADAHPTPPPWSCLVHALSETQCIFRCCCCYGSLSIRSGVQVLAFDTYAPIERVSEPGSGLGECPFCEAFNQSRCGHLDFRAVVLVCVREGQSLTEAP